MKIAIFTDSFLPGVGGTENAVLGLATELSKNHEVAVFCPEYKTNDNNFSFKVVRCKSIKISGNETFPLPKFSPKFNKEVKKFAPDIVHIQSISGVANAGLRYALKHKLPTLFTVHTKFREAFKRGLKFNWLTNFYINLVANRINKSNLCCTVCKSMVKEVASYGKRKEENLPCQNAMVIRNGMVFERETLSEEVKNLAKDKYGLDKVETTFLFVGRIIALKNIDLIFETLKAMRDENFKMIFVGIGADISHYQKLAVKEKLDDKIIFTGKIPSDELKSLYYNADLFLFPSIFDNDPLVITEAALFNTPSITLAGTGSSERITHNHNGFIAKDEDDFVEMTKLLSKDKEKLRICGENAEREIPKNWEEVAKEYLQIYENLIKAGK